MGQPRDAILQLEQIPPSAKRFFLVGEWYRTLAYLRMDSLQQAEGILNTITVDPRHPFNEQALRLQQELD